MEARYLPRVDGPALLYRKWPANRIRRPGAGTRSVFIGHSQPTHSGMLQDLAGGFRTAGWDVHSGDIRGHGKSTDKNIALGHLEARDGWDRATADMRHLLERAFEGTDWEDRLIVVPNITALLTLEVMKTWPDLARHIVLISPPPNQKTLALFAKAFADVRMRLKDPNRPDEQILHHLYTFLGTHLKDRRHLADVMSNDADVIRKVIEDPEGWPTPTTAYWSQIFAGMISAWKWPRNARMMDGTRVLILFGGEDAMLRDGGFLPPIERFLNGIGVQDVASERVDGARSALFLEEEKFSVSRRVLDWAEEKSRPQADRMEMDMEQLATDMLTRISDAGTTLLKPEELVELCYNAIEDDSRWSEIIYRMIYEAEQSGNTTEEELQDRIAALMPHWERAFNLNKQVMMSATLGVLLQSVIERLQIGVALLDRDNELLHANAVFDSTLSNLMDIAEHEYAPDGAALRNATRRLLDSASQVKGERVVVHEERPVGFQFFPDALRQTGLQRHGPASLLVLRDPSREDSGETRQTLLELAYGLTGKEAEIALRVADGKSLDQIAAELGILVSTTRGHLKKSFQKIGVHSQSELAARLLAGPVGWLG